MNINQALLALKNRLPEDRILLDVPMKEHTTFRTGGSADMMILPAAEEEVSFCLAVLKEFSVPALVMGRGSNLIVRDGGFRGAVVKLAEDFSSIDVKNPFVTAQAGAPLSSLVAAAHAHGLCGMEFAGGIPGTVGGAVVMNAGAYGGEIKDFIVSVIVLDKEFQIHPMQRGELRFGYRKSVLQQNGAIVLSAVFRLQHGDVQKAKEVLNDLNRQRRDKQPLSFPSAGSIFKRPPGHYAGTLIECAGLKGFLIGGAQVSEKHAGFIVNTGEATSSDILALISEVQKRVFETSGVMLETEVKIVGEDAAI